MNTTDSPPFAEAVSHFRAFLAREGLGTDILWVFREDVIDLWPKVFVKSQIEPSESIVERLYVSGQRAGLGIVLDMFCMARGRPCCYIWLPKDREDASHRMCNGLHLKIPTGTSRREAAIIRSRLRWRWLKWCEARRPRTNWADDIPSRAMTEDEWLASTDPWRMLDYLRGRSERKRRLFVCACGRRIWHLLAEERFRTAMELNERFTEGQEEQTRIEAEVAIIHAIEKAEFELKPWSKVCGLCNAAKQALWGNPFTMSSTVAATLAFETTGPINGVEWFGYSISDASWEAARSIEQAHHATLLRDIFGNPFRPVTTDPRWLTQNVVALAQTIYDERAFDRLPELADALAAAGCDNQDILDHCRSEGPHVRGCWVVDLVLGKE